MKMPTFNAEASVCRAAKGYQDLWRITMSTREELMAPFLILLIGELTGWNGPIGGGGDPVYLTAEQTAALAAEGISLLASYLPQEAAQRVTSAIERLPRPPKGSTERVLLSMGRLGGTLPSGDSHGGCCVGLPGGKEVCVRSSTSFA
jgi:hypothetical protein